MKNIIFYISGHGYGHATRAIELIKALKQSGIDLFFHIKTDAPRWIFELNLKEYYTLHHLKLDVGTVQNTSFRVNKVETFKQCAALFTKKDAIISEEKAFAQKVKAQLILADIPPLAFDIAQKADLPSVALANFSWDWIYKDYLDELPEYSFLLQEIKSAYSKANLLLRLPFYGDLTVFRKIKDISLIARKASKSREEVWRLLKIDKKHRRPLVLVAFRPSDLEMVDFQKVPSMGDFLFITLGLPNIYKNCLNLPPDFVPFYELVNACDMVISKPGYGIVSEIIANQTPLLYTAREDFAEYFVLVEGLKKYAVTKHLPQKDFLEGNWGKHLKAIVDSQTVWKPLPINGAGEAAEIILSLLNLNNSKPQRRRDARF